MDFNFTRALNLFSFLCFLGMSFAFKLDSSEELWPSLNKTSEDNLSSSKTFWSDVVGQEHITRLNSENFDSVTRTNTETFVMFYANWCSASSEVKEEFGKVALEMAYTEGFSQLKFASFDCNESPANKEICQERLRVTKYPWFLLFRNSTLERMYNTRCPRLADYFYAWIVSKGDENYCSGAVRVASTSEKRGSNPFSLVFAIFTGYWRTVIA